MAWCLRMHDSQASRSLIFKPLTLTFLPPTAACNMAPQNFSMGLIIEGLLVIQNHLNVPRVRVLHFWAYEKLVW